MFEAIPAEASRAAEPLAHLRASASALVERVADLRGLVRLRAVGGAELARPRRGAAVPRTRAVCSWRSGTPGRRSDPGTGRSRRPGRGSPARAPRRRLGRSGRRMRWCRCRRWRTRSARGASRSVTSTSWPVSPQPHHRRSRRRCGPLSCRRPSCPMAERQSVPDFARSIAQLAAARDPQALEDSHEAARRERSLVLSHQARGTYLKGFLDRVAGEALQAALDSAGQAPDETRSPAQANADALVAVARRACAGLAVRGEHDAPGLTGRRPRRSSGSTVPAVGRTSRSSFRPRRSPLSASTIVSVPRAAPMDCDRRASTCSTTTTSRRRSRGRRRPPPPTVRDEGPGPSGRRWSPRLWRTGRPSPCRSWRRRCATARSRGSS